MKTTEEQRAYQREYYKKNREKIRKHQAEYVAANPGISTAAVRKWRKKNPEKEKDRQRKEAPQRRARELKNKYNLTPEQFDQMLADQGGTCAISGCGARDGDIGRHGRLHVDHDHTTGLVRGILCSNHNTALGKVRDDVAQLQAMIDYLLKNKN